MEQTTPTRITLPLSALDAVVEAALEVSAVLAVPPCALEEQPPKTPAAIAAAMVRERTRVAFFIVSPSFFNVRSAFFSQISPDQTKARSPPSSGCRTPLCKSKISFVLFMLLSPESERGPQLLHCGPRCPLLHVWIVLIIAYCQNFASTFVSLRGILPPITLFY